MARLQTKKTTQRRRVKEETPERQESSVEVKKAPKKIRRPEQSTSKGEKRVPEAKEVIEVEMFEQVKPAKKVKAKPSRINLKFYPEKGTYSFPQHIEESLLKVIASLDNNAKLADIVDNLGRFYTEKVSLDVPSGFHSTLRHLEEEGVLFEKNGVYSVHLKFLPVPPLQELPQVNVRIEMEQHEFIHREDALGLEASPRSQAARDEDILGGKEDGGAKLFDDDHNQQLSDL